MRLKTLSLIIGILIGLIIGGLVVGWRNILRPTIDKSILTTQIKIEETRKAEAKLDEWKRQATTDLINQGVREGYRLGYSSGYQDGLKEE